jgi:hypothetical protein
MPSPTILIITSLLLILLARLITTKIHAYNALSHFKGPWSTGFSRLWLLRANSSGEMHKYFKEVNDKYGPWNKSVICATGGGLQTYAIQEVLHV